jgi:hypothetical protein
MKLNKTKGDKMNKERAKEILKEYETRKDLFNWCEEYKQFVNECVSCCVTTEWDYILKKSFEDNDAPFSYNELDLIDYDSIREEITYNIRNNTSNKEELKDFIENLNLINITCGYLYFYDEESELKELLKKDVNEIQQELINYIDELSDEGIFALYEEHPDIMGCAQDHQKEIYEWWVIQDPLKYRLEQQGETILNGAWGRCSSGQSISLDYCVIRAYLSMLRGWL